MTPSSPRHAAIFDVDAMREAPAMNTCYHKDAIRAQFISLHFYYNATIVYYRARLEPRVYMVATMPLISVRLPMLLMNLTLRAAYRHSSWFLNSHRQDQCRYYADSGH